jgi:hypothetical protein
VSRDWVAWHADYEADTPLARRLAIVQEQVAAALRDRGDQPTRILSLCSGEGRDLLAPLTKLAPARHVTGRLVELDPTLAGRARAAIEATGLAGLEVLQADAGTTASFAGAAPADLVLVCGVFGNISDADIERTVGALPMLCAEGATLLWTRHRRPPDLTPAIRDWFERAGFRHEAFIPVPNGEGSVGVERYVGAAQPFRPGVRLFEFIEG